MALTVACIRGSTTTTLSGGAALVSDADGASLAIAWLEAYDGAGMPNVRHITEHGPAQHGVTRRGYRLDPRTLTLVLGVSAQTLAYLEDAHDVLLDRFTPGDDVVNVRFTRENGSVRQLDATYTGGLSLSTKDRSGFYARVPLQFFAEDPSWYDPTQITETFGAGGASSGMAVPWIIPWKFGATSFNQSRTITYNGSWRSYPIITIKGPITDAVVTSTISDSDLTGDTLDFTGTTIANGTTYTIDCRYGIKTVKDQAGTNQISKLSDDSDLATFALWNDPIAAGGANTITVTGTGISSATEIYVTYYERYVGL